ncbi:MAG: DNA repair protein RecO [Clostridium sp.]
MRELIKTTGIVLSASSVSDYDKRLVILTRERGKITAFAKGAKRPGSLLLAPCRPFAFGVFSLSEGRDAYSLYGAEIENYFADLGKNMESACYASYFNEFSDYYEREGIDGSEMIKLLYQSYRVLIKSIIPKKLVRRIFELKAMTINGEYSETPRRTISDSARYAWEYVVFSSMEKLYTFTLTEEVLEEFAQCVEDNKRHYIDKNFHSLEILETLM